MNISEDFASREDQQLDRIHTYGTGAELDQQSISLPSSNCNDIVHESKETGKSSLIYFENAEGEDESSDEEQVVNENSSFANIKLVSCTVEDKKPTPTELESCLRSYDPEAWKTEAYRNKSLLVMYSDTDDCDSHSSSDSNSTTKGNDSDITDSGSDNDEDGQLDSGHDSDVDYQSSKSIKQIKKFDPRPRSNGEVFPEELPKLNYLTISAGEDVELQQLGMVTGVVDVLVVIQSVGTTPALYDDTVLFLGNRKILGVIFETFGTVDKPFYSIRFNSNKDIVNRNIKIGDQVFFAPKANNLTKYVFLAELRRMKACDASWESDNEAPPEQLDYSDDEQERAAKKRIHLEKRKAVLKGRKERRRNKRKKNEPVSAESSGLLPGHMNRNPFASTTSTTTNLSQSQTFTVEAAESKSQTNPSASANQVFNPTVPPPRSPCPSIIRAPTFNANAPRTASLNPLSHAMFNARIPQFPRSGPSSGFMTPSNPNHASTITFNANVPPPCFQFPMNSNAFDSNIPQLSNPRPGPRSLVPQCPNPLVPPSFNSNVPPPLRQNLMASNVVPTQVFGQNAMHSNMVPPNQNLASMSNQMLNLFALPPSLRPPSQTPFSVPPQNLFNTRANFSIPASKHTPFAAPSFGVNAVPISPCPSPVGGQHHMPQSPNPVLPSQALHSSISPRPLTSQYFAP